MLPPSPIDGHATDSRYERDEVDTKLTLRFLGGLALCLALCFVGIIGVYSLLIKTSPVARVSSVRPRRELPPSPRLQVNQQIDWDTMKARDLASLNGYGRNADGSYHIPIEQAIDLTMRRGLPARPQQVIKIPIGSELGGLK